MELEDKFGDLKEKRGARKRKEGLIEETGKLFKDYTTQSEGKDFDRIGASEELARNLTRARIKHGFSSPDEVENLAKNYRTAEVEGINDAMRLLAEGKDEEAIKVFQTRGNMRFDDPAAVKITRGPRDIGGGFMYPEVVVSGGTHNGKPTPPLSRWDLHTRTMPPDKLQAMALDRAKTKYYGMGARLAGSGLSNRQKGEGADQNEKQASHLANTAWGQLGAGGMFSFEGSSAGFAAKNASRTTELFRETGDMNAAHEQALRETRAEKLREEFDGFLPGISRKKGLRYPGEAAKAIKEMFPTGGNEAEIRSILKQSGLPDKERQDQVINLLRPAAPAAPVNPATQGLQQRPTAPPAAGRAPLPAVGKQGTPPPPQAFAGMREGKQRQFQNGQVWTIRNGQPVRVQ